MHDFLLSLSLALHFYFYFNDFFFYSRFRHTTAPAFRRAPPPAGKSPASRAAIPAGQTNTAAHGANGTMRLNKRMAELGMCSRREGDGVEYPIARQ